DRVWQGAVPRSRGVNVFPVAIEDHDRVLGVAIEAVDPVLRVDRYRAGADIEPLRRVLPPLVDSVGILAAADDWFHFLPPIYLFVILFSTPEQSPYPPAP